MKLSFRKRLRTTLTALTALFVALYFVSGMVDFYCHAPNWLIEYGCGELLFESFKAVGRARSEMKLRLHHFELTSVFECGPRGDVLSMWVLALPMWPIAATLVATSATWCWLDWRKRLHSDRCPKMQLRPPRHPQPLPRMRANAPSRRDDRK